MSQRGTIGIRDKGILMGQRDPIYGTIGILMGQRDPIYGTKGSLRDKGILMGQRDPIYGTKGSLWARAPSPMDPSMNYLKK